MGQQIFDLNANLNRGDWTWFRVINSEDNDGDLILAFRYSADKWAFYGTDENLFSGSCDPRDTHVIDEHPFLSMFTTSWIVSRDKNLMWGVQDLTDGRYWDVELIQECKSLPNDATLCEETATESADAENFILDSYEKRMIYTGMQGYHDHHGDYLNMPNVPHRGHRIGVELEVEFKNDDYREDFCDKTSNWFYLERDGSLGSYGCEIITIPLRPIDAKSEEFWTPLTNHLSPRAKSWDTGRCGLHVHIGREILGRNPEEESETLGKLLYLYHSFVKDTRMNIKIYGRDRGYHDQDGKTRESESAKHLGSEVLKIKSVKDRVKTSMIRHADTDRYFDINIRNEHTIEFRKGRGSINPKRIAMVVDYCERLCIYAKMTPWVQISYEDFVKFLKSTVTNSNLLEIVNCYS